MLIYLKKKQITQDPLTTSNDNNYSNGNITNSKNNINNSTVENNNNLSKINEVISNKKLSLIALLGDLVLALTLSGIAEKIHGKKLNAGVLGGCGLLSALIGIYQTYGKK